MIEQSLMVAFGVCGIWGTMWKGGIFGFIGDWGHDHLPAYIQKPLYDCIVCMCFWWGSGIYFCLYHGEFMDLWGLSRFDAIADWLGTILAAMGMNAIVVKFLPENWYTRKND